MAKILVVDDTAVDRRLAGGLLETSQGLVVNYAENGKLAMAAIEADPPDLVVTDMQMPEMGGLELVSQIRLHYPSIPVVLMTAQGSEAVAVEALERGAANYVPKSQLADRLQATVQDLLGMVHIDRSNQKLLGCQKRLDMEYELENDGQLVDSLADLLQNMIGGMELTDETGQFRIGVALREALHNALYHGNLEISREDIEQSREQMLMGGGDDIVATRCQSDPFKDRRIRVHAVIDRKEARFVIEDDGKGFDYASLLTSIDPGGDGGLNGKKGRGFVLMLSLMDEVSFNETGNCVTMVKQKTT